MIAELQNVSKHYERPGMNIRNMVLNEISLSIQENETIAIVGPSGSGKSTLLNLIGTLDRPSSGKVMLDGMETEKMNDDQLADIRTQFTGYVFQMHYLLPQLTLLENVLLPVLARRERPDKEIARQRAMDLIERVGLAGQVHQFPYTMSVGECQRAAVIRALMNQPKLLLADEPTGSLDAENAIRLGKLLVDLNREQNIALVVVTHSIEIARLMKTQYNLVYGKLIRMETP